MENQRINGRERFLGDPLRQKSRRTHVWSVQKRILIDNVLQGEQQCFCMVEIAMTSVSNFTSSTQPSHIISKVMINPFIAMGHFHKQPPRWPTFLAMLFEILKEGMGLSLLEKLEVQYHVIKK